jgi:hypothetical protein
VDKGLLSADLPFRTVEDGPLAGPELTESTERGMCWSQESCKAVAFHSVFMDSLNY